MENLLSLNLEKNKIFQCPDAAFAMNVDTPLRPSVLAIEKHTIFRSPVICFMLSSEVNKLAKETPINYIDTMTSFIKDLNEKGYNILLLAHSSRKNSDHPKNNDLPLCIEVSQVINNPQKCFLPDEDLNAEELRHLIGKCKYVVTSRFHGMISSLAMGVPVIVIGWSHKYLEILKSFKLHIFFLDYKGISLDKLIDTFATLESTENEIRDKINTRLPQVISDSLKNAQIAAQLLKENTQNNRFR